MSGLLTKDFISLLQKHKVEFLICGGHAVGFYGYPRLTMDFDFLFQPTSYNAEKIMNVLKEFGFGDAGIPESAFLSEGTAVTLGVQPNQIDLLTSVSSINTESIFNNAVKGKLEDFEVLYISKYDLIQCKKAAGRAKDLADVEELEKITTKQIKKR
jgi:hypothetical protein